MSKIAMTTSPSSSASARQDAHRRQTRLLIVLPFALGVLLIIALAVIALALPDDRQTSLIADFLMTIVMLCPAVICLFPLYILMVIAAVGMSSVHRAAQKPLDRLNDLSESLYRRVDSASQQVAEKTIDANVRLTALDRNVFSIFDRNDKPKQLPASTTPEGKDE
jgi:hypothetical protein